MVYAAGVISNKAFQTPVAVAGACGVRVFAAGPGEAAVCTRLSNEMMPKRTTMLNTANAERKRIELRLLGFTILSDDGIPA